MDTSSVIVLCGLIFAVFLVLSLTVIVVVCFRRQSRRNQKYRAVNYRDPPPGTDLPLKAFPDVGGPTSSYHTGCDLGLSTSGSVCLCRELSGGLSPPGGDSVSINSTSCSRPRSSGCRVGGCDVAMMMTSHGKMAAADSAADYHRQVGWSIDVDHVVTRDSSIYTVFRKKDPFLFFS